MWIVKVWSEWELSCNDLFMSEEKARAKVARALEDCGLEESLEEYMEEGLISFEDVWVTEDGDD
jgi:hypothetical protein